MGPDRRPARPWRAPRRPPPPPHASSARTSDSKTRKGVERSGQASWLDPHLGGPFVSPLPHSAPARRTESALPRRHSTYRRIGRRQEYFNRFQKLCVYIGRDGVYWLWMLRSPQTGDGVTMLD